MKKMKTIFAAASVVGAFLMSSNQAIASDPILGNWMTKAGTMANITECNNAYCIRITSGPFTGKPIGKMTGSGGKYEGKITNPENSRTYAGSAEIKGNKLYLKGCAARLFCSTQKWTKR